VELAADPPRPDPRSGKFRQVWSDFGPDTAARALDGHREDARSSR